MLAAFAAALATALAILYAYDPAHEHFFPTCPMYSMFGLLCPGCGTLRATHRLLHGDVIAALQMNPVFILSLPFLGHAAWTMARRQDPPVWLTSSRAGAAILVGLVGYSVLRNLPMYPFTLLAPH